MTPEQRAIRQHLSKPRPTSSACGCVGPQRKPAPTRCSTPLSWDNSPEYFVEVTDFGEYPVRVMKAIHTAARHLSLNEVNAGRKSGAMKIQVESSYNAELARRDIHEAGGSCSMTRDEPGREPYCPCSMKWVEEVDAHYYRIEEQRTPDGIIHTAVLVGHVAGPYTIK